MEIVRHANGETWKVGAFRVEIIELIDANQVKFFNGYGQHIPFAKDRFDTMSQARAAARAVLHEYVDPFTSLEF